MNKILRDNLISILSSIGVIFSLLDIFGLSKGIFAQKWFSSILFVAILLVIIRYYWYKKKFLDLYDTLRILSENNKLHPIREMVVIVSNQLNNWSNRLKIACATFTYSFGECHSGNIYDVTYNISLLLKPYRWLPTLRVRTINFYAICEEKNKNYIDRFLNSVHCHLNVGTTSIPIVPSIFPATTSGESNDRIPRFAGLYKISIVIPPPISLRDHIRLDLSYLLYKNVHVEDQQYSFVILPCNDGKKVDAIEMIVEAPKKCIQQISLHQMGYKCGVSPAGSFIHDESQKGRYLISGEKKIKPDIHSAYVIQMDFKSLNRQKPIRRRP